MIQIFFLPSLALHHVEEIESRLACFTPSMFHSLKTTYRIKNNKILQFYAMYNIKKPPKYSQVDNYSTHYDQRRSDDFSIRYKLGFLIMFFCFSFSFSSCFALALALLLCAVLCCGRLASADLPSDRTPTPQIAWLGVYL